MKSGYTKERAEETVEKIDAGEFASHGIEKNKETQQKEAEIMRFFQAHNDFIVDEKKWMNVAKNRGVTMNNLMKRTGGAKNNRNKSGGRRTRKQRR